MASISGSCPGRGLHVSDPLGPRPCAPPARPNRTLARGAALWYPL